MGKNRYISNQMYKMKLTVLNAYVRQLPGVSAVPYLIHFAGRGDTL